MLSEIVIEDVPFKLDAFVECLIERLRKDGRTIPDGSLSTDENQFVLVIRSSISTLLVNGILETQKGVRRLTLYICPDLETVKAVSKLLSLSTKALELSGALVTGPTGILVLAGKFGLDKLMERRKKERELRRFRQMVTEICETDLQLETHLIEPFEMGLPRTTEKSWINLEYTYRVLLDTVELRMRHELSRFFKIPVKIFRDRSFKDGMMDIFSILGDNTSQRGIISLVTNRKPSSRPFRADEITHISKQAMNYVTVNNIDDPIVICIFCSATNPPFEPKVWKVLSQTPFMPGIDNPYPLLFLLPPNHRRWNNVVPPSRTNRIENIFKSSLQLLGILKPEINDQSLYSTSSEIYLKNYQTLIGFWARILSPFYVKQLL